MWRNIEIVHWVISSNRLKATHKNLRKSTYFTPERSFLSGGKIGKDKKTTLVDTAPPSGFTMDYLQG